MKKWMLYAKKGDFSKIANTFGIDPVLARIIRNRDVVTNEDIREYLEGDLSALPSPWSMKGVKEAVDIIFDKIESHKKLLVLGDYDIDGVCATYILFTGLCKLGGCVDYTIPDRITDGYGINERLIQEAYKDGIDTIITCDNGIAAEKQIAYAKEHGMTVVVTDHHEIPYTQEEDGTKTFHLPCANVIVNPKQEDCTYGFDGLCGAVVALKLVQALYEKAGKDQDEWQEFLEMAAIATVGDVMQLQHENRTLVKEGLKRLKTTNNLGLDALMEVTAINRDHLSAYHLGFVIGPCLNAGGRLETAIISLRLLLAQDKEQAMKLAVKLRDLNESRKEMTAIGVEQAFSMIESGSLKDDKVLIVFLPDCHESIAGIIAGKIRERYYKPVLVFTRSEDGVKASGRSIEAYHMYDELSKCKDLMTKFGGHAMAAGLSMKEENLDTLRQRLNAQTTLTDTDLIEKVHIDVPMPIDYVTENLINELQLLEPFGNANSKPVFAERHLKILWMEQKGRARKILKLKMSNGKTQMDAIYFGDIEQFERYIIEEFGKAELFAAYHRQANQIDLGILYYPSVNEYMGMKTLQVVIDDYCHIKN